MDGNSVKMDITHESHEQQVSSRPLSASRGNGTAGKKRPPIILIGLDGADALLVDQFCAAGKLPAINGLRERGCRGTLACEADLFAGGVWPTFYTSKDVEHHGIYHNKLWRHVNMRCEVADENWLPEKPFWELIDDPEYRMAIIDVPMTVGAPKPFNGIHLCGWGTHDLIKKGAWPGQLWKEMRTSHGVPLTPVEDYGPQSRQTLAKLRQSLELATEQMTAIGEALAAQEDWDLFLLVYGAPHRAGHYLLDMSQIDTSPSDRPERNLDDALLRIYQACDRGIDTILKKAPEDAIIILFAVHGIGKNPGWSDYCAELVNMIQSRGSEGVPKTGLLYSLRKALPWEFIRSITKHLPKKILDRLVALWTANMFDWTQTRYFPLPMDHAGYIRINLKGREPQGIVEPGREYHHLCDEIELALCSFRDKTSGQAIVKKVCRRSEFASQEGAYLELLPDLIVLWNNISAIDSEGVYSELFGELNARGGLPSGRAGNHTSRGWFAASGPGIPSSSTVTGYHIKDLVPTVFSLSGLPVPKGFQGKKIIELCR